MIMIRIMITGYIVISHVAADGQKLVSCGNDGFLKIFDMKTGSEVFAKNSNNQSKWVDLIFIIASSTLLVLKLVFRCFKWYMYVSDLV